MVFWRIFFKKINNNPDEPTWEIPKPEQRNQQICPKQFQVGIPFQVQKRIQNLVKHRKNRHLEYAFEVIPGALK